MKKVFGFVNEEQQVMRSSSGGAFIALCNAFESIHGKENVSFYGVTYDKQMNVCHMRVESAKECAIFQGSKYVKSDCNQKIFTQVKEDLLNGKKVLFSGTPCQVFGLKNTLKVSNVDERDLLTVDVICHGTPDRRIWDDYKQWLENKKASKLINYSFRYKPEGWKAYPALAEFENGDKLINTAETSVFSKMHMKAYSITKGCFSCPFSKEERVSDITLGDFWGIENINHQIYNKKGVSLILVNSRNGEINIDYMKNGKILLQEIEGNEYLKYQHNLRKATEKPNNYDTFWKDYEEQGYEFCLKKYLGFGNRYIFRFNIKKIVRKTIFIELYRKYKNWKKK